MEKKMSNRGGKREGAGRKKGPVEYSRKLSFRLKKSNEEILFKRLEERGTTLVKFINDLIENS